MSATLEHIPVEVTKAPNGTLHMIRQDPDCFDTLCGLNIRTKAGKPGWEIRPDDCDGLPTCLPCRLNLRRAQEGADEWGNFLAREGCDRCDCGAKYWENDTCTSCGGAWDPSFRGEEEET
jgi:hypothetical protein